MTDDGEVVGDEEVRKTKVFLKVHHEVSTWLWTETSSAETGSSQTIRFGLRAMDRAMPIR